MEAALRIELLDGLRLIRPGCEIVRFRSEKVRELLALLALHPGRAFQRDEAVEQLWSDVDMDTGRNRLRFTLSTLLKHVEPVGVARGSIITAGRKTLSLVSAAVSTDVGDFESALRQARFAPNPAQKIRSLVDAAELYHGQLLPGLYADWLDAERDRLNTQATNALCELAAHWLETGDTDAALDAARRAANIDPCRESAHRLVISLYRDRGEDSEALRQFLLLERALQDELGTSPSPETRRLIEGITVSPTEITKPKPARKRSRGRISGAVPPAGPAADKLAGKALPVASTSFYGRERETAELCKILADRGRQLITLHGPGGVGKTRLALEVAHAVAEGSFDRVVFLGLIDIRDGGLLPEAMASALGLRTGTGRDPVEQISEELEGQRVLILLDNFEHLLETGQRLLGEMLERLPSLTCLVTSQFPLETAGGCDFRLYPMHYPSPDSPVEELVGEATIRLFVDRAQMVRPDFALTPRNARDIALICRKLEGLPLATELAAWWIGVLAPTEIRQRLEHPLDLLVSREHRHAGRHRAIRNALDHTFALLSREIREALPRLSVFSGGWTVEAAEYVLGVPDAAVLMDHCCHSNLIFPVMSDAGARFHMLEMIRAYASEMLNESERQSLAMRHAAFFRDLGIAGRNNLDGPDAVDWLRRLSEDEANLVLAVEHCLTSDNDVPTGVQLAEALWGLWQMRGYSVGQCRWLLTLLSSKVKEGDGFRPRALACASYIARVLGENAQAMGYLAEAIEDFEQTGDRLRQGFNLCIMGQLAQGIGQMDRAQALHEESHTVLSNIPHPWGAAMARGSLGRLLAAKGDFDTARRYCLESVKAYRKEDDSTSVATALGWLATVQFLRGHLEIAEAVEEESLCIRRELGRPWGTAHSLVGLARILTRQGAVERAEILLREGLDVFRTSGDVWGIAYALYERGVLETATDDANALDSLREALALRIYMQHSAEIAESFEAIVLASSSEQDAIGLRLLALAESIRSACHTPVPPVDRAAIDLALKRLREQFDPAQYQALWSDGQALAIEEGVAYARALKPQSCSGTSRKRT